jgi:mercuric ion transport protein
MNAKQTLTARVLAAIGASACCVAPLVLLALGIGGAWLATLTNLEPLRPVFVAATLILLGLAWRKLRQRSTPEKLTKATTPAGYPPTLKTK